MTLCVSCAACTRHLTRAELERTSLQLQNVVEYKRLCEAFNQLPTPHLQLQLLSSHLPFHLLSSVPQRVTSILQLHYEASVFHRFVASNFLSVRVPFGSAAPRTPLPNSPATSSNSLHTSAQMARLFDSGPIGLWLPRTSLRCLPHTSICQAMSTSTLKEQRKEKVLEWTRRPQQMPRDVIGRLISHHQLRCFEKGFPNPVYFKGVFRSSLGEIYKLRVCTPRGWDQFRDHVRDERTMSNEDIYGEGYHTYLKLEDVLQEGRLYRATSSLRTDWENETLHEDVTSNPDRPYAVHHRSHVTGVFYDPPHRHAVGGTYVLHCGSASSFNHNLSDGPNFILKVGHSKDILRRLHEHQRTSSNLRTHGEVVFLFGVETDKCDRVPAESLLKVMMTEFVFSRVTVYNNVLNLKVSEGTHAVEWSALAHLVLMVEQSKTREQQDVHGKIGIEEETLWENPL